MLLLVAALASAFSIAQQVIEPLRDPCRRSHCTFESGDLPYLLVLTDLELFSEERLRVAPGVDLAPDDAADYLLERHVHGHGGCPDEHSSKTLAQMGLASCDASALDALSAAAWSALGGKRMAIDAGRVARWLERNGRVAEAESLILAAIPPGSKPENELAWTKLGEFLFRRGRYEEALPLIEKYKSPPVCGLGMLLSAERKFDWVKRCCDGLYGGACDDLIFKKRFEIVGTAGLAEYVAQRLLDRGSPLPERDAIQWFESTLVPRELIGKDCRGIRGDFASGLREWSASRAAPNEFDLIDWALPSDVARAVARAREVVHTDLMLANLLLDEAAETGLPVAGKAVLELLADRSIAWRDFDRKYLKDVWVNAILTRTFGCADPEDPKTW